MIGTLFLHQPMIAALHYVFLFIGVSFDLSPSPVLPSALPSVSKRAQNPTHFHLHRLKTLASIKLLQTQYLVIFKWGENIWEGFFSSPVRSFVLLTLNIFCCIIVPKTGCKKFKRRCQIESGRCFLRRFYPCFTVMLCRTWGWRSVHSSTRTSRLLLSCCHQSLNSIVWCIFKIRGRQLLSNQELTAELFSGM